MDLTTDGLYLLIVVFFLAVCGLVAASIYWIRFKIYFFFCRIADIFCDSETIVQRKKDRQWFLSFMRLPKDKWVDSRHDESGSTFFRTRLPGGESVTLRRKYMGTVEICEDLIVCSMPVGEKVVYTNILDMPNLSLAGACYYYCPHGVQRKNCRLVDFLYDQLIS